MLILLNVLFRWSNVDQINVKSLLNSSQRLLAGNESTKIAMALIAQRGAAAEPSRPWNSEPHDAHAHSLLKYLYERRVLQVIVEGLSLCDGEYSSFLTLLRECRKSSGSVSQTRRTVNVCLHEPGLMCLHENIEQICLCCSNLVYLPTALWMMGVLPGTRVDTPWLRRQSRVLLYGCCGPVWGIDIMLSSALQRLRSGLGGCQLIL